ncbi:hypothetical protein THAOC_32884, partial [Thalassiosira oceanica]
RRRAAELPRHAAALRRPARRIAARGGAEGRRPLRLDLHLPFVLRREAAELEGAKSFRGGAGRVPASGEGSDEGRPARGPPLVDLEERTPPRRGVAAGGGARDGESGGGEQPEEEERNGVEEAKESRAANLTDVLSATLSWAVNSEPALPGGQDDRRADLALEVLRAMYALGASGLAVKPSQEAAAEIGATLCDVLGLSSADERCYQCKLAAVNLLLDAPKGLLAVPRRERGGAAPGRRALVPDISGGRREDGKLGRRRGGRGAGPPRAAPDRQGRRGDARDRQAGGVPPGLRAGVPGAGRRGGPQGERGGTGEGQEHGAARRAEGDAEVEARQAHDVARVEREAGVVRAAVRPVRGGRDGVRAEDGVRQRRPLPGRQGCGQLAPGSGRVKGRLRSSRAGV